MMVESRDGQLKVTFPEQLVSTNVESVRAQIESKLEGVSHKQIVFDFRATQMIDSTGLNLLTLLLDRFESSVIPVKAVVEEEFIRMILHSVWLDQRMDILSELP